MIMMSLGKIVTDKDFMKFYGIDEEKLKQLQEGGLKKGYFIYGEDYKFSLIYSKQAEKREERKEARKYRKRKTRKVKKDNLPDIDIPVYEGGKRFVFEDLEDFTEEYKRGTYKTFVNVDGKDYPVDIFCACMDMSRVYLRTCIKKAETFVLNGVKCKITRRHNPRVMYNLKNNKSKREFNKIHRSTVLEITKASDYILQGLNEDNPKKIYRNFTLERVIV